MRKSSWGGSLSRKYGELNKENLALKESEEEHESDAVESDSGGTMRKSSRGTTIMTGAGASDSIDESTDWTGSVDEESAVDEPAPVVLYEETAEVA